MFWSVTVYDIDTRSQMRIYLGDRAASSEAIDAMFQALSKEACKALHTNGQAHEVVATRIIDLARSGFMDAKCGYDAATFVKMLRTAPASVAAKYVTACAR